MTVKEMLKRADVKEVSRYILDNDSLEKSFKSKEDIEDVYNQLRVLNEKKNDCGGFLYITNFWKDNHRILIENVYIPHKKCVYAIPMIDWRKLLSLNIIDEQIRENDVNEVVAFLLFEMTNLGKSYSEVSKRQHEIYARMFEQKKAVIAEVQGYFESIIPKNYERKQNFKKEKAYIFR